MTYITKISKDSVSELVYNQLMDNVVKGRWVPGDKIPSENQLSELFGVSRVSVREAIKKMITLGLLEAKVGEGTFVKEFNPCVCMIELAPIFMRPKNQIEILEFRKVFELGIISMAIERAGDEEIRQLEHICRSLSNAARQEDFEEYVYQVRQFHALIFAMSKNSMFIGILRFMHNILMVHYQAIVQKSWQVKGIAKIQAEDRYYKIFQAMADRDRDVALQAFTDMIDDKIDMFKNAE